MPMRELTDLIDRHCRSDREPSAIPRLELGRSDKPTKPGLIAYSPLFCVLARGRKRVWLGEQEFVYGPASYLINSVDITVTGHVVEAPYLGCMLALDPKIIAQLLLELPATSAPKTPTKAFAVAKMEAELLDAVVRLLRLLDRPQHIPVMAPLIEREILYLLLQGLHAGTLRQFAAPASPLSQVRRAIDWIRANYREPLRVDRIAKLAGMSAPSLHRHFRAVTNQSPLQYQKRLRLQEARRRLLSEHADAASIAFDVGYESPSQFNREYRRLFGAPPVRDVSAARRRLAFNSVLSG
jgi:AraC-like DNA-binding protein